MSTYPGITEEVCATAFNIARDALQGAADLGIVNRFAGSFVVIGPYQQPSSCDPMAVSTVEARECALFMGSVEPDHPDAKKYDEIALTKARDLWVLRLQLGPNFTGLDVQQCYPHLYTLGMTKWHGAICRNGVIYAFSGVQGHYDEAFSTTAACWTEAWCRQAMVDVMKSDDTFIED